MLTLNNLLQCYNTKPKIMTKNNSIGTNYTKWTANLKFKDFSRSLSKKKIPFFKEFQAWEKNPKIEGFTGGVLTLTWSVSILLVPGNRCFTTLKSKSTD